VDEYSFRYNHRTDEQAMFMAFTNRIAQVRDGEHGDYSPLG
jgi:hypothetical protein